MHDRTETNAVARIASATAGLMLLAACTTAGGGSPGGLNVNTAGGPAGSGGVCAYYSGTQSSGNRGPNLTLRRRACFSSLSACRAWLYRAQTRFPVTQLRKGCGS